jgi:hypothetical protein
MIFLIILFLIYYIYKNDLHNQLIWPSYKEMVID